MNLLPLHFSFKQKFVLFSIVLLLAFGFAFAIVVQQFWVVILPVAIAAVFASILYTEKALLFFGSLAPLSVNNDNLFGGFGMSLPTEPMYIFLFLMLMFHVFKQGDFNLKLIKHPLVLTVVFYLLWLWITSIFSTMNLVSVKFSLARTWYITLFFFFGIRIFKDYSKIHWFLKSFTIFTLICVAYTLVMHSADGFSRSSSYGISWPFFPDHGMYAASIAFAFFVLFFYTFYVRQFDFHVFFSPLLLFALFVLTFGIIVSFTRATWLSLVVAFGVWAILNLKVKFSWILIVLLSLGTYAVVQQDEILYSLEANKQGSSDELEGHVKSVSNITTDPSNLERINRWKCASRMVSERPWFGFGPGTYVFKYGPFQKSSELTIISTNSGDLGDAHSEFFSAMSEMGYIGLILWTSLVLMTVSTAFKVIYQTSVLKVKLTATLVLLSLITYYTHAVLNNYSQYDKVAVPLWAFTAIIVVLDIYHKNGINNAKKTI